MRAEYINPFLSATMNVVQTMANIAVQPGKPQLKKDNRAFGAVTGVIGMAGTNVTGNMVLSFQQNAILKIVSSMLMEEFREINETVIDAVGEITNMVCGGAKSGLNELGLSIRMASPVMLVGENVEINQLSKAPVIVMPFSIEGGQFVVEANLAVDSIAEQKGNSVLIQK